MIDLERQLPEGWTWQPLKHVTARLSRGTAPEYVDDGPVHAVSQAVNQEHGLDWSRGKFHGYSGDPKNLKGYLERRDILINSTGTGTLGRIGFFDGSPDSRPCVADGHVTVARTRSDMVDPRFAYYWLGSSPFYDLIYSALTVGSTNQIELNRERLATAPVPVPRLDEQRRIADFLDGEMGHLYEISRIREKVRGLLSLKRGRTVESVLGLSGEALDASRVPLKFLAKEISVGIVVTPAAWYVENGVTALRGVNIRPGRIVEEGLVQISQDGHALHRKSKLNQGDLVVVRTGQAGAAAVVPSKFDGVNCIDLVIVRPGKEMDSRYAEYVFNSDYAQRQIKEYSVGSIQSHFNVAAMKQMSMPKIPRDEQRHRVKLLDDRVGDIDQLLDRLSRQEQVIAERRQALITAAVTGQIDVTTAMGADVA